MTPWTDKEIERFSKRVALFARRGLDTAQSEALADRLAARDQERDDRRVCIECAHLQRDGNCFKAKTYSAEPMAPVRNPVTDLLQRCAGFTWQMP